MSDGEIQLLRVEVAGLREELESVQSELVRLRRTIAALRIGEGGTSSPVVHHSVGEPSESGYSSVTSLAAPPSVGGISRASEATADTIAQLQRNRPAVLSWAQREALCEDWQFFEAISGRGSSRILRTGSQPFSQPLLVGCQGHRQHLVRPTSGFSYLGQRKRIGETRIRSGQQRVRRSSL